MLDSQVYNTLIVQLKRWSFDWYSVDMSAIPDINKYMFVIRAVASEHGVDLARQDLNLNANYSCGIRTDT